ncbi:uncharacterized protein LOC117175212 [Belonocnema kinseyi]|uniref:uncharacterized protein LOC117175212 n=1 Tax=Belonocnema kinseyi TaxID=2817044 RepID=UPI00143D8C4A|nr:uncharacterized protein LOC117175212 [Belonocnema kinseyi]
MGLDTALHEGFAESYPRLGGIPRGVPRSRTIALVSLVCARSPKCSPVFLSCYCQCLTPQESPRASRHGSSPSSTEDPSLQSDHRHDQLKPFRGPIACRSPSAIRIASTLPRSIGTATNEQHHCHDALSLTSENQ